MLTSLATTTLEPFGTFTHTAPISLSQYAAMWGTSRFQAPLHHGHQDKGIPNLRQSMCLLLATSTPKHTKSNIEHQFISCNIFSELRIYIYIWSPPPPMIHLQAFYMGITSVLCTFFFTRKMTFSCFYFFYLLRKLPTQTHTHAILFLFTFLSFLEVLVKNPKNIEKTKKNKKNKIARPM